MSWLERLGRVIRAKVNSLIQEAEDPEKILEQAIAEMEHESIEMRRALAAAIATNKSTERQIANHQAAARRWYESAQLALDRGNEPLAREALLQRQFHSNSAQSLEVQTERQRQSIAKFKQDLRALEGKFVEAKAQKNLYLARLRSAIAAQKLQQISGNLNNRGSYSVFEQIEAKILELEAESELLETSGGDPLLEKFASLEAGDRLEAELAEMKRKQGGVNLPVADTQAPALSPELEKLRSELDRL
jgi:phage shock protein A